MKKFLLVAFLLAHSFAFGGWELQQSGTVQNLQSVTASHSNHNIAWACGDGGLILHTTNGGTTWVTQASGTTANLYGIAFMEVSGGPVFAVGEGGLILRTTNSGLTWNPILSPTSKTLHAISDFGFFAVGDSGTILKSTNEGLTWSPRTSGTTEDLLAVTGVFSAVAAGRNGTILTSTSTGLTWTQRNSGTTYPLYGLPMFFSPGYVVGGGGRILESSNALQTWSPEPSGTTQTLRALQFSVNNTSRCYVVGNGGTILKTTNNGLTWGQQSTPTAANLNSVFFYLDDSNGYAVGDSGVILRTSDAGGPIAMSQGVFPLHTGNVWQLEDVDPMNYMLWEAQVIGDTLLPNGRTYRRLSGFGIAPEATIVRQSGSLVLAYSSTDSTERVIYDFSVQVGDTIGMWNSMPIRLTDKGISSLLGSLRTLWTFSYGFLTDVTIVDSIGLFSVIGEPWSSFNFQGAIVNGVQYGTITNVGYSELKIPSRPNLFQNYPNPFNASTNIGFEIRDVGFVSLKVYDLLGQEVATLANEQMMPGSYERTFEGNGLGSGIYFYRLRAGEFTETRKLLLLK